MAVYKLLLLFAGISIIAGCGNKSQIAHSSKIEPYYQSQTPETIESINEKNRYRSEKAGLTPQNEKSGSQPFNNGRIEKKAAENVIDRQVYLGSLFQETTFGQAIDEIRNSTPETINITVLWKDLERDGISADTPVSLDPVGAVKLKTALKLIFESVSGGYDLIDYKIVDSVVIIATNETLARFGLETQIHDISDLTHLPGEYRTRTINNSSNSGVSNR